MIGQVLSLLLTFTNRAWLPRLKGIVQVPMRWRVIEEARNGIYLLVAWAVLGVTVASPVLLRVFAPASYHPEDGLVTVVFLVACSAFPLASVAASGQLLITVDRSAPLAVGAGVAVLIKAVVTAALIMPLGIVGAATGTLVALLAQAVVLRWFAVRTSPRGPGTDGFSGWPRSWSPWHWRPSRLRRPCGGMPGSSSWVSFSSFPSS